MSTSLLTSEHPRPVAATGERPSASGSRPSGARSSESSLRFPRPSLGAFSSNENTPFVGRLSLGSNGSAGELRRSGVRGVVELKPSFANIGSAASESAEDDLVIVRGLPPGMHGLGWPETSLVIVAEVLGTGVLAVPGALRTLGWVVGLMALLACYPLNLYTGLLLGRVHRLAPAAVSEGDLAHALLGRYGGFVGWAMLYVYLLSLLGDYMVVMGTSFQSIFETQGGGQPVRRTTAYMVSCALLLATNQIRTLEHCTLLCALSALAMVVAIALSLQQAVSSGCESAASPAAYSGSFAFVLAASGAFSSFILAFAGQPIFLEMISEMRAPRQFPLALNVAMPWLFIVYAVVGGTVFAACGDRTPSYLLDAIPAGTPKRIVGALLFVHTLVSYTLNQQVLARGLHLMMDPWHAVPWTCGTCKERCCSRMEWFAITTTQLAFALLFAVAVPDFENVVCLIGALLASPLSLGLPLLFLIKAPRHPPEFRKSSTEVVFAALLLVFAAGATIMGTVSAVRSIFLDVGDV